MHMSLEIVVFRSYKHAENKLLYLVTNYMEHIP